VATKKRTKRGEREPRIGAAQTPTWEHVLAELAYLWSRQTKQSAEDRDAWVLIWAGAKHFGAAVDFDGNITDARVRGAAAVLRGGDKERRGRAVRRYIEALFAGAKAARGFTSFDEMARLTCQHFGRPDSDAAKLAKMLANVVETTKSGRLPKGKFTRGMIAAWITRERWETSRGRK